MISPVYNFLVLNFCKQGFQWEGGGGASLHENWILEGDEQVNIRVNAFVFLSLVVGLIFGAKLIYRFSQGLKRSSINKFIF